MTQFIPLQSETETPFFVNPNLITHIEPHPFGNPLREGTKIYLVNGASLILESNLQTTLARLRQANNVD